MLSKDKEREFNLLNDHNKINQLVIMGFFLKTLKLVIQIFNISFFTGIFWYIVTDLTETSISGHNEHADTDEFLNLYQLHNRHNEEQLLIMIYFSFTTLSTVGFGDYTPRSNYERLVGCVILIFGVAIFSYIMGNFIEILG